MQNASYYLPFATSVKRSVLTPFMDIKLTVIFCNKPMPKFCV